MEHSVEPSPNPDAVVDRDPAGHPLTGDLGAIRLGMTAVPDRQYPHTAEVAGTFGEVLKPQEILTCVEWMRRHKEPVSEKLWEGVYQIAQHGRSQRTRMIATRMLADRFDPIPRELPVERGPVSFNVIIGNTDRPGHETQGDSGRIRIGNSGGQST